MASSLPRPHPATIMTLVSPKPTAAPAAGFTANSVPLTSRRVRGAAGASKVSQPNTRSTAI